MVLAMEEACSNGVEVEPPPDGPAEAAAAAGEEGVEEPALGADAPGGERPGCQIFFNEK